MIEKKLVEILDPVLDQIIAVEKRLDSIALTPGPEGQPGKPGKDGNDADPVAVADVLVAKYADVLKGNDGKDGEHGKDGRDGERGADGKDVDPDVVSDRLKSDPEFIQAVKGADGIPGKDGTNADPREVAKELKNDDWFLETIRGEKGERGEPGAYGRDGKDGIGIKSIDQEGETLNIVLDSDDTVSVILPRGEKGDAGERGLDGLGIQTKAWEPGIYREGSYVTAEIGRVYKAVRDTNGEPGKSEDWERIGASGFAVKGVKKEGYAYQDGDLYIDGGTTFIWWQGKGRMFAQRGAPGAPGPAGKDGQDGLTIVAVKADASGFHLAMSDGSVQTADVEGLHDYVDAVAHAKTLNFLEAQAQQIENEGGTPFRSFMGQYAYGHSYSTGDVVRFNKSLWIAKQKTRTEFIEDDWRRVYSGASAGGGGGTGGITRSTQILADGTLNMGGFLISNVLNPRQGPGGAMDAVNQQTVDAKVAAGSLFRGTVNRAGLPGLPPVSTNNRGWYWTWVGEANHVVQPIDGAIDRDLHGEILQVGDWVQSNGTAWVHVPGDLLSKQRWNMLGGFTTFVPGGSYESGSLVIYNGQYYRSARAVGPADPNPGTQTTPPITMTVIGLTGRANDRVRVQFAGGPVQTPGTVNINYSIDGGATQQNGFVGNQAETTEDLIDSMIAGWLDPDTTITKISPTIVEITPANGKAITALAPVQSELDGLNAGGQPWVRISPTVAMAGISDVTITSRAVDDGLRWNGTAWVNVPMYNKAEVDAKISALQTGVSHGTHVLTKGNTPPTAPIAGEFYMTDGNPTGAWAGQPFKIAEWLNGAWVFRSPAVGDTHSESQTNITWSWNGTAWVRTGATGIQFVTMTQAGYNALGTKDPNTLYLISG